MTRPQKDAIAHLDFTLECSAKTHGVPCQAPARWFAEMHRVRACTHPSLNDFGNLERYVCDVHLQVLEMEAERVIRQYQPSPWYVRWFREDAHEQKCPSCSKSLLHPGDVLQCVIQLPEGTA
jgi:hypothetical protein